MTTSQHHNITTITRKCLLVIALLVTFIQCDTQNELKNGMYLSSEDLEGVLATSEKFNTYLRQKSTIDFIKKNIELREKIQTIGSGLAPFLTNVQMEAAESIIARLVNNDTDNNSNQRSDSSNDDFALSSTCSQLTERLADDIKQSMISALEKGASLVQISNDLERVISNFKSEVGNNPSLTLEESRALLAVAEFQKNSIPEIVNMAASLNTNNEGGRTQGWFSKLVSVVVAVVVATVVVAAAAATGGAMAVALGATISQAGWGIIIGVGAAVGAAYGGVVGYDMAFNRNSYISDFDPFNVGGGFLDWESCSVNPGHWGCL